MQTTNITISRNGFDHLGRGRITAHGPASAIDRVAAEHAVSDLLAALGGDLCAEHLYETPRRVVAAFEEMLTPPCFDFTTFANDEGYDELIVSKGIPFQSLCEHHLLCFTGVAHVGYIPGERLLGLSKLARVVELFARRLQMQERLTIQVADWLQGHLAPRGVGVVFEAEHQCMTRRGVQASGSRTITSALQGLLRHDARSRNEFFAICGMTS